MMNFFSNRELSIILWSITILFILFFNKEIRKSLLELTIIFFKTKIIDVFLLMIIYIELLILFLACINFWEVSLLKDSIFWILFAAFPLIINTKEKNSLKKVLKDSIKVIVLIQFIINFYNFSFIVELIFVPVIILFVLLEVTSKRDEEHKHLTKFFKGINVILGITITIYSLWSLFTNFDEFVNFVTLKSFLFPIIITILFLPFLYFVSLYSLYETMLIRLSMRLENSKDKRYLKRKLFFCFLLNLKKLRKFQRQLGYVSIKSKEDIDNVLNNVKYQTKKTDSTLV